MSRAMCGVVAACMATPDAQGWCNSVVNDGWRSLLAGVPAAGSMAWRGVRTSGMGIRSCHYEGVR